MDYFTTYGESYEEILNNLEKLLKRCKEHNPSLNNEKCFMMMTQGIVLGNFISSAGIQVDPHKIEIKCTLPIPQKQRDIRSFLGHASYYKWFIKYFSKISTPLFVLIRKLNLNGHQSFNTPLKSWRNP